MAENSSAAVAWEIKYMTTVYDESLDTLNSYMEGLWRDIGLLYGPEVINRLKSLSLHEDERRLAGMLVQLAVDERIAMLDGCDFLRICNIRLVDLLKNCSVTHEGLVSEFVGDLDLDLQTCMIPIENVYGRRVSAEFKDLVRVLMRGGASFEEAVQDILQGKYGTPCSWVDTYLAKDAEYWANLGPLFENLQLDAIGSDDGADAKRESC
jgi:hypothetical protein